MRTEVWQLFEFWVHPTESLTWGVFPCSCAILTMLSPMHVTRVRYLSRTYYILTLLLVTSPLTTSPGPLCDQSLWIFFLWSQQTPWNWQQSPECHISPCSGNIGQYFHLWANFTKKRDWGTEKKKSLKFFDIARLVGIAKLSTAGTCVLVVLPPLCFSFAAASPWYTKLLGAGHNNLTISDLTINLLSLSLS